MSTSTSRIGLHFKIVFHEMKIHELRFMHFCAEFLSPTLANTVKKESRFLDIKTFSATLGAVTV